jgi:hypothetical protein
MNKIDRISYIQENPNTSNKELASLFGLSIYSIPRLRKIAGVYRTKRKYQERDAINDFNLGWCAGLFAADGSLSTNRKKDSRKSVERIELVLTERDKQTVYNFYNTLLKDFEEKDIWVKVKKSWSKKPKAGYISTIPNFTTHIKTILNFVQKTYDVSINDRFFNMSDKYKIGFIRGLIDGDGYIFHTTNGISIVSASHQLLLDIQKEFGGIIKKRKGKKNKCWDIFFRVDECLDLIKRGLIGNNITMQRKTDRIVAIHDKFG